MVRRTSLGSDLVLNPLEEDVVGAVRHETGGQGANVVITACPAAEVQTQAVQLLAPFGRLYLSADSPRALALCHWIRTRSTTAVSW